MEKRNKNDGGYNNDAISGILQAESTWSSSAHNLIAYMARNTSNPSESFIKECSDNMKVAEDTLIYYLGSDWAKDLPEWKERFCVEQAQIKALELYRSMISDYDLQGDKKLPIDIIQDVASQEGKKLTPLEVSAMRMPEIMWKKGVLSSLHQDEIQKHYDAMKDLIASKNDPERATRIPSKVFASGKAGNNYKLLLELIKEADSISASKQHGR